MHDWRSVDHYLTSSLVTEDEALRDARLGAGDSTMPGAEVAPNQGALLALLARMCQARRVLEIGTLTGYSTIWLARAADHVTTLELDPGNAERGRRHLETAGVGGPGGGGGGPAGPAPAPPRP